MRQKKMQNRLTVITDCNDRERAAKRNSRSETISGLCGT